MNLVSVPSSAEWKHCTAYIRLLYSSFCDLNLSNWGREFNLNDHIYFKPNHFDHTHSKCRPNKKIIELKTKKMVQQFFRSSKLLSKFLLLRNFGSKFDRRYSEDFSIWTECYEWRENDILKCVGKNIVGWAWADEHWTSSSCGVYCQNESLEK